MHRRLILPWLLLLVGATMPAAAARAASEMTFRLAQIGSERACGDSCPDVIVATGEITQATPDRFLRFVETQAGRANLHSVVFLDSPGGRVLAAMEFGTLLRKVGAAAIVGGVYGDGAGGTVITNGRCFSACVYALIGARKRVVPASSQIGIHRMFAYEDGDPQRREFDNGDMRSFLMRYSRQMGVSPALIAAAEQVPSTSLRILSRAEIRRWHLGVPHL